MSMAQDTGQVYALLADGTTVEIRQAVHDDFAAVRAMHEAMSPDNIYLEHLVSLARSRQITSFTAETLIENRAMLEVFADAGLPVQRHFDGEGYELTSLLPRDEDGTALGTYLSAVAEQESSADATSLRHLLAPGLRGGRRRLPSSPRLSR